jgi:predicted  nucleic acid-binding Zn-ribbon protein
MSENMDNNFLRLYSVLDKVTESLSEVKNQRDAQQNEISSLAQSNESNNNAINGKINKIERYIMIKENIISNDINKIRSEIKTFDSRFTEKVNNLELQIKGMEESLGALQKQFEENNKILKELIPVAGQKRKRCWLGF